MDRLRLPTSLTTGIAHRLPSLRPHTHRPQLRGLRPCPTNFFKFSLLVLNRGHAARGQQSCPPPGAPTHPVADRPQQGPVRRRAHRGAAQGVWGGTPCSRGAALGGGRDAGELMRPLLGALYGGGGAAPKAWGNPAGVPFFGHQRTRYRAKCERLKINNLKRGYATAHWAPPQ